MFHKDKDPTLKTSNSRKLLAFGAVALAGITGVAANAQRGGGESITHPNTPVTQGFDPEKVAPTPTSEVTQELREKQQQSALQVVRRVKGGSGGWDQIGSANVIEINGKKYALASGHQFDPFNEFAMGDGAPEDIAKSSGYEFGVIKAGTDPNTVPILGMADGIAVSRNAKSDVALMHINETTASVDYQAIEGLRLTDTLPELDHEVALYSGNEATSYKPSANTGKVISGELSQDGRSVFAIATEQDVFGLGASGSVFVTANGAIGTLSSRLESTTTEHVGAFTVVSPDLLAPFEAALA